MSTQSDALRLLSEIQYATVATVTSNGEPWNTPVFCAADGFDIYWSSHPESIHSQNIAATGKAFLAIYNSKAGEGEGLGLYMKATVQALSDVDEITHALDLLGKRRGRPFLHIKKFIEGGPQRIYRAKPTQLWMNDADQDEDGDFIRDYRLEVPLDRYS